MLRILRQVHLYFGVFIAPAVLFFAFTGALQTFSLHETTQGSSYKPPAWAVTLGNLHKKQTIDAAPKKPKPVDAPKAAANPPAANPSVATTPAAAMTKPASDAPTPKSHLPMKIFFLLVTVGLFSSTLTGIYMAYKYKRNNALVTVLLIAGVLVPLLLLRL